MAVQRTARRGRSGSERLERAARVAVRECLAVGEGERVLIVTNPPEDVATISEALYRQVEAAGGRPVLLVQPVKGQLDLADPAAIAALGSGPGVVLSISAEKLGKDREALRRPIVGTRGRGRRRRRRYDHVFDYLLTERRIRSFWSPGVTRDMFERTVPIDYRQLQARCAALASALTAAAEVRVTTPAGTDLVIGLRGRRCRKDDGDFSRPGAGGNIPCGEVFISPELGTARGQLVFDGSISSDEGAIVIGTPIECEVEGGSVKEVSGGPEARRLRATLDRSQERALRMGRSGDVPPARARLMARNALGLGELGIGLNPEARIIGNMLEDEKAIRTCHVAIGANYDDDAPALTHLDGLMKEPTIVAVGRTGRTRALLQDGGLA